MKSLVFFATLYWKLADAVKLQSGDTCRLVTFIPFTDSRPGPPASIVNEGEEFYGYGQWSSPQALGKASFSLMAAAQMAKDHFNARDAAVVPDLKDYESCSITMPDDWILDSSYSRSAVVSQLLNITQKAQLNGEDPDSPICAVIGPTEPRANEGTSVITENLNIPQIAYETIDKRLARSLDFPFFVRGIPAAADYAATIAEFVQRDYWNRSYVGVIYDQSDYGEQFEDPLEDAEDTLGYVTLTEHVIEGDQESIHESLGEVVDENFRTVFFAAPRPAKLDDVALVADDEGIIGDEYVWILTDRALPPESFPSLRFEVDSHMDRLLRGAALVTNYDPFVYEPEGDPFLDAWKRQGNDLLDRLRDNHPLHPSAEEYFVGQLGYFQNEIPTEHASFLYDAIVNAGMAACRAVSNGSEHLEEVFASDFEGASGRTVFKPGSNARAVTGVKFGLHNLRPGPTDEATNTRGFTRHLVAVYDGTEAKWIKVEGEEFVFFDGTTTVPDPVRGTVDWNFLQVNVQTTGFVLVGLALAIVLVAAAWVFIRRKERIVTTAQPEFLYLICFGAVLTSLSLIFLSFDESYEWTDDQLDRACSAVPWLFVLGYLIQYCAVFSKLWRLSMLLSLRRRAVEFKQVLVPFALIISSSIVILVVWQVLDPLQWERELISGLNDEGGFGEDPWISYGQCKSVKYGVVPFIVPLAILFAVIIGMTLSISWKMRDVQEELSEAKWIFIAIFSHFQFWAIGIPIYFVLESRSRDASYLISMALVFVFAVAFVLLIIYPRMISDIRVACLGADPQAKTTTRVSINQGSTTYISGINTASGAEATNSSHMVQDSGNFTSQMTYNEDKLKIMALEAEIQDLKASMTGRDPKETAPLIKEALEADAKTIDADCEASPT